MRSEREIRDLLTHLIESLDYKKFHLDLAGLSPLGAMRASDIESRIVALHVSELDARIEILLWCLGEEVFNNGGGVAGPPSPPPEGEEEA